MQHFSKALCMFLLPLLSLAAAAQGVAFRDGEEYQLRCLDWPAGCVVPMLDAEVGGLTSFVYRLDAQQHKSDGYWRVKRVRKGEYTLQHSASRGYLTYDGRRTATHRYVTLLPTAESSLSHWRIYPGSSGLAIINVGSSGQALNVRYGSLLVGTYRSGKNVLGANERFFLVDKKGRPVTEFDGGVTLTEHCFGAAAGTPSDVPVSKRGNARPVQHLSRLLFTIDGRMPVWDEASRMFFHSLSEELMGRDAEVCIVAEVAGSTLPEGKLYVDGRPVREKKRTTLVAPGAGRVHRLAWVSGADTLAAANLTCTFLPIVELSAMAVSQKPFRPGTLCLHDPSAAADSTYATRLRYRGASALGFSKKSLAVKLVSEKGEKLNRSLLGLRTDNYWILDAMAVDHARMRNRVAMDLWMDMSTPPYYDARGKKARMGVRGRAVEVFFNGRYHGVYHLTERIDRKQLALTKTEGTDVCGLLYKSAQWSTWTLLGFNRYTQAPAGVCPPGYDNAGAMWNGWESEYPEPDADGKHTDWEPLWKALALCATASDAEFCERVGQVFDLPVVADYWLFCELLHAVDNSGKNMYWAVGDVRKSAMLTPVPWDLDGTFGRSWDGHRSDVRAANDYRRYLLQDGHQNALFERLHKLNPEGWNERLAERYRTLRRSHFDADRLMSRFEHYHHLMQLSGADRRERTRWDGSGGIRLRFSEELSFICSWLEQRLESLDRKYGCR